MNPEEIIRDLIKHQKTLLNYTSLRCLWALLSIVNKQNIPGCLVEAGVYRGGASILMEYANQKLDMNRKVWLFDSFQGTPDKRVTLIKNPPSESHGPGMYKCDIDQVKRNFTQYNLLSDNVIFTPGWFETSMPKNKKEVGNIAILRIDGDLFSSTMDVLINFYDSVVENGFIIIDDYCLGPSRQAVNQFRKENKIIDTIFTPNGDISKLNEFECASFWKKGFKYE